MSALIAEALALMAMIWRFVGTLAVRQNVLCDRLALSPPVALAGAANRHASHRRTDLREHAFAVVDAALPAAVTPSLQQSQPDHENFKLQRCRQGSEAAGALKKWCEVFMNFGSGLLK
jgi:hypothetical protein